MSNVPSEHERSRAPASADALAELFTRYRKQLRGMVEFRLDDRLTQRLDPSDILQEAFVNALARLPHAQGMQAPPIVWLRQITEQTLIDAHRRHLGAECRTPNRELVHAEAATGRTTSIALAAVLMADDSGPGQSVLRAERAQELEKALNQMDAIDREVIALRHFEELSNNEVAEILGLQPNAACNRYVRALDRLRTLLESLSYFNSRL